MTTAVDATLQVSKLDADLIAEILAEPSLEAEQLEGAGMDGGGAFLTIVLSISGVALPFLLKIMRARWDRAKHVKLEVDGVKIEGASPDDIERLLKRVLDARNPPGSTGAGDGTNA